MDWALFRRDRGAAFALILATLSACGDDGQRAAAPAAPAPTVIVAPVTARAVAATHSFIGRTQALRQVDLRARVTGFLAEIAFKEGENVAEGALLFRIDPAEFEAARAGAEARVARARATLTQAEAQLQRTATLAARGTTSEANLDDAKAAEAQARSDLAAAEADLRKADLDLGYTRIAAPIAGRIGAYSVDAGNLIGPDSGVLASIVDVDPIRVVFSITERDYLLVARSLQREGEVRAEDVSPRLRLATGEIHNEAGRFVFLDNRVDPATGTIRVFVEVPNAGGLLLPGQSVDVLLTPRAAEKRLVVAQRAIQRNQAGPFVLVVGADNRVSLRQVETGARDGADVVVASGLREGELVIVDGVQKVRPGAEVAPSRAADAAAR